MEEIKTLYEIDLNQYYEDLALSYNIKPEHKDDFIKRMKTYSNKRKREEIGGNKFIHLIKMINI